MIWCYALGFASEIEFASLLTSSDGHILKYFNFKLRWRHDQDLSWIISSKSYGLADQVTTLYVSKRFLIQTLFWSLEFVIHEKSWAQHHRSVKLGSKLKYLDLNQLLQLQGIEFGYSESAQSIKPYDLVV